MKAKEPKKQKEDIGIAKGEYCKTCGIHIGYYTWEVPRNCSDCNKTLKDAFHKKLKLNNIKTFKFI